MTLEFFPYPLLIGIVILIVILAILWSRKHRLSYLFCFSVFWIYVLLVVNVTLFPMPIPGNGGEMESRQSVIYILSHVNLIPFYYGEYSNLGPFYVFLREIVANIVLTAPFGFGISFIVRFKARNVFYLAVAVGVVIETTQLVLSVVLGSAYRGVDINDVLMNAIGVLIGYGFFRVFSWLYVSITERVKIELKGLFAYVYTVANGGQRPK